MCGESNPITGRPFDGITGCSDENYGMTKNEIKRLKILMKNELDVDKKKKIAMQIVELKKEDV